MNSGGRAVTAMLQSVLGCSRRLSLSQQKSPADRSPGFDRKIGFNLSYRRTMEANEK
jgi:hypothetical protein